MSSKSAPTNPPQYSIEELLGEVFGMWLVNEKDGTEWLDVGEWHISDGVDSCSGYDGSAQLESYKRAVKELNQLIYTQVLELIPEKRDRFGNQDHDQWFGATYYNQAIDDITERIKAKYKGDNRE